MKLGDLILRKDDPHGPDCYGLFLESRLVGKDVWVLGVFFGGKQEWFDFVPRSLVEYVAT